MSEKEFWLVLLHTFNQRNWQKRWDLNTPTPGWMYSSIMYIWLLMCFLHQPLSIQKSNCKYLYKVMYGLPWILILCSWVTHMTNDFMVINEMIFLMISCCRQMTIIDVSSQVSTKSVCLVNPTLFYFLHALSRFETYVQRWKERTHRSFRHHHQGRLWLWHHATMRLQYCLN